ncbi:FtsX-like permease family protein [Streptomyces sp. NPDC089799]|uniref:FtsX-like permease family protein n=1 Tax=Streptomyces sp. NPDC089799 TaxID=3155066 RepID=UPI0034402D80
MSKLRTWGRDFAMGARFAFGGGREGWTRTLLTGLGVGIGVALLLITTSLPNAFAARDARGDARGLYNAQNLPQPGPDTLLVASANQTYHGKDIGGVLVRAEGPRAPVPPGLKTLPAPGEIAVSPALKRLLESGEGRLLRERLDGKITQIIGDAGLIGPHELYFYTGYDLSKDGGGAFDSYRIKRIDHYAIEVEEPSSDPVLLLLVLMTLLALLLPVAVFIAAAVRFGGERRDRRLAALRLVGADGRMVRRIAAGEALAGALTGLAMGAGLFFLGREVVGNMDLRQRSFFPHDLTPNPALAALVAALVPTAAVLVTVFALRGVVIEPLGVVRTAKQSRRRVWWRLLMPAAGAGLLFPMLGQGRENGSFNQWQVSAGVVLLLVGTTALLPWLLERLVRGLSGGPVSWQLAVRRLQVNSGTAARLVSGVAVAVAGAIALQMLFVGSRGDFIEDTGYDLTRATAVVLTEKGALADDLARKLEASPGVRRAVALRGTQASHRAGGNGDDLLSVTIGSCAALKEIASIDSCKDGDAFMVAGGTDMPGAKAGEKLFAGNVLQREPGGPPPVSLTVPANLRTVHGGTTPTGGTSSGLLLTPSAAPAGFNGYEHASIDVLADTADPDAMEHVRTAVFKADVFAHAMSLRETRTDSSYASVQTGLYFGAAGVLALIGTSLLVSRLEQLRERRKLLAALVAFGTRRSTLTLSELWQSVLPIAVGLLLAAAAGTGLGLLLLGMTGYPVRVDWTPVLTMTGIGAAVVTVVTLLSLPPLLRVMRPDGLRTE